MNQPHENNAMNPVPAEQRKFLERWLLEWELACRGGEREAGQEAPGESGEGWSGVVMPFSTDVGVGDIRLLSPKLVPGAARPIYVAVLSDWDEGRWLVAPFSAYSVPATRGELAMMGADHPLKTLCLWNARDVSPEVLAQSWLVDRLPEAEQSNAWTVFRHVAVGAALPATLATRVGPPVLHASDPRREYQREESERMLPLADWAEEDETPSAEFEPSNYPPFDVYEADFGIFHEESMPLAAGSGDRWTQCLLEADASDGKAPAQPAKQYQALVVSFDSLRGGHNYGICCEWWVKGAAGASHALVYAKGILIGVAHALAKPDGMLVVLNNAELPAGAEGIDDPTELKIVLRN